MTTLTLIARDWRTWIQRVDKVWLVTGLGFVGLSLIEPQQSLRSFLFLGDSVLWIAPFLLLSVALAAGIKAAGLDSVVARVVVARTGTAIVLAAAAGAFSPFCSCGVVPLVAALLAAGVPLPVVFAFWVSSPLMDPETFIIMLASVGLELTLAKTVAAFGLGLLGGALTWSLQSLGLFGAPLKSGFSACGSSALEGSGQSQIHWRFWQQHERRSLFWSEGLGIFLFLAKWLVLAFFLESLMVAWLPSELVVSALGGSSWQAIPLSVALGVPAYVNSFAAIPLIGELLSMGMAPGAGLAFLIAGGITSLPAAMAVFALVRAPVFLWYLLFAVIGATFAGLAYQSVLGLTG